MKKTLGVISALVIGAAAGTAIVASAASPSIPMVPPAGIADFDWTRVRWDAPRSRIVVEGRACAKDASGEVTDCAVAEVPYTKAAWDIRTGAQIETDLLAAWKTKKARGY